MHGVLVAGGTGSRLWPLTATHSKHLLPIYDKPLIYYPLATLMAAGLRDICLVSTPRDIESYQLLLGNGNQLGISLQYAVQEEPNGIAGAVLATRKYIEGKKSCVILGDNVFHGAGLGRQLSENIAIKGAKIFAYQVANPGDYGVVEFDFNMKAVTIEEKPENPKSDFAVPGLYFYDEKLIQKIEMVKKSARGEYEITSINEMYLSDGELEVSVLQRGVAWLDTGSPNGIHDAASYVKLIEERQGLKVACLEEVALIQGWISKEELKKTISNYPQNSYTAYLRKICS
jgi:glucose-1-phosphate thymidylyltransferase